MQPVTNVLVCVLDTCWLVAELAQLSEKELDAKVRELENWNFRLNLDEGVCVPCDLCCASRACSIRGLIAHLPCVCVRFYNSEGDQRERRNGDPVRCTDTEKLAVLSVSRLNLFVLLAQSF